MKLFLSFNKQLEVSGWGCRDACRDLKAQEVLKPLLRSASKETELEQQRNEKDTRNGMHKSS